MKKVAPFFPVLVTIILVLSILLLAVACENPASDSPVSDATNLPDDIDNDDEDDELELTNPGHLGSTLVLPAGVVDGWTDGEYSEEMPLAAQWVGLHSGTVTIESETGVTVDTDGSFPGLSIGGADLPEGSLHDLSALLDDQRENSGSLTASIEVVSYAMLDCLSFVDDFSTPVYRRGEFRSLDLEEDYEIQWWYVTADVQIHGTAHINRDDTDWDLDLKEGWNRIVIATPLEGAAFYRVSAEPESTFWVVVSH